MQKAIKKEEKARAKEADRRKDHDDMVEDFLDSNKTTGLLDPEDKINSENNLKMFCTAVFDECNKNNKSQDSKCSESKMNQALFTLTNHIFHC